MRFVCPCFLDLLAAFNMVDHGTLLYRLDSSYQIVGSVQQLFQSYLLNRLQHVRVRSSSSSPSSMVCGVPKVLVLGSILFLLYCGDLQLIIESHGLCPHLYADDSQIYGSCRPSAYPELKSRISKRIDYVAKWMRSNCRQLNAPKTEIIWSSAVRDLGIHLHSDMSLNSHVGRQCQHVSLC